MPLGSNNATHTLQGFLFSCYKVLSALLFIFWLCFDWWFAPTTGCSFWLVIFVPTWYESDRLKLKHELQCIFWMWAFCNWYFMLHLKICPIHLGVGIHELFAVMKWQSAMQVIILTFPCYKFFVFVNKPQGLIFVIAINLFLGHHRSYYVICI